jgi:predicted MPP superfamily phosphohydrolase
MSDRRVAKFCDQITSLKPDLILVPGDIIDTPAQHIPKVAAAFRRLKAPHGVWGSTGNHEYYVGLRGALELIEQGGIRMLMNTSVELPGGLVLAGIEDRTAKQMGRPLPEPKELLMSEGSDKVRILLNHTPATADMQAAIDGGADLVVCGHTHGGQIWPFKLLTKLAFPYHHGLYPVGDGHVLTTCGIGVWGPPMRLGAPPEIMVIRFVPQGKQAKVKWG